VITQENHYSPFGLSLQGVDFQNTSPDNFKYSQNEQQSDFGINLYDFGARFSDPTTGNRFLQMDPLAEISRRFSPYIYANANPLRFVDPDGMSAQDVKQYTTNDGTTVSYDVNTQKTLGYDTSTQGEGDDPPSKKQEKGETPKSQMLPQTFGDKFEKQQDRQLVKNGDLDVNTYNQKAHSIVDPLAEAAYSVVISEIIVGRLAHWFQALKTALSTAKGVPALRAAYESEVKGLSAIAGEMRTTGSSSEQIARALHGLRRELGVKYKALTSNDLLQQIYQRNLQKYGDKLGPSIDYLRQQGKSWDDIINSATRPGGKDLKF
jgi:RHS repeat-associated protein